MQEEIETFLDSTPAPAPVPNAGDKRKAADQSNSAAGADDATTMHLSELKRVEVRLYKVDGVPSWNCAVFGACTPAWRHGAANAVAAAQSSCVHASPQGSLQVDIREMYRDKTGDLKPTQKGLALTAVQLHCPMVSNVKQVVHIQPCDTRHDTFISCLQDQWLLLVSSMAAVDQALQVHSHVLLDLHAGTEPSPVEILPAAVISHNRAFNSELALEKAGDASYALELSENRRASVSIYKDEPRVDLREYYEVSLGCSWMSWACGSPPVFP